MMQWHGIFTCLCDFTKSSEFEGLHSDQKGIPLFSMEKKCFVKKCFIRSVTYGIFLLRCVLCGRRLRLGCRWWSSGFIQQPSNSSAQQGKQYRFFHPSNSSISQTLIYWYYILLYCTLRGCTFGVQVKFKVPLWWKSGF